MSYTANLEDCAKSCESKFQECVGFTWFEKGLCAIFSKFTSIQYYPVTPEKCPTLKTKPAVCMAKFSKFSGTTIKPDGSGKCANCLTTATKADRCPEAP